jgi:hypothetical protein
VIVIRMLAGELYLQLKQLWGWGCLAWSVGVSESARRKTQDQDARCTMHQTLFAKCFLKRLLDVDANASGRFN